MNVLASLRRGALLVVVAAFVAGCASPPEENKPGDLNCDGDRNGIPDGQSPVEGTNSTCEGVAGEENTHAAPGEENVTNEPSMPGIGLP